MEITSLLSSNTTPPQVPPSPPTEEELAQTYKKLTLPTLKQKLKEIGLPTTGNKNELIQRLVQDDLRGPRYQWKLETTIIKFDDQNVDPLSCSNDTAPIEIFNLFWGNLIDPFVDYVNETLPTIETIPRKVNGERVRYPRKRRGDHRSDIIDGVFKVNKEFCLIWIAIWLQMSLVGLKELKRYWSCKKDGEGDAFVKGTKVPRDDWFDVNVALCHLSDDCLEFLEEGLNKNFQGYCIPGEKIAIDECMEFAYRRNVSWKRTHFLSMLKFSIMNSYTIYCKLAERKGETKGAEFTLNKFSELLRDNLMQGWTDHCDQKEKERKERARLRKNELGRLRIAQKRRMMKKQRESQIETIEVDLSLCDCEDMLECENCRSKIAKV